MQTSRWAPRAESAGDVQSDQDHQEQTDQATPADNKTIAPASRHGVQTSDAPPEALESSSQNYADPSMDSFAQTAGTDDLFFDDDFTPIAEPVVEQAPVIEKPQTRQQPPAGAFANSPYPHNAPRGPAGNDRGDRGRGRGRGRGQLQPRGRGGHQSTDVRKLEESPVPHEKTQPSKAQDSAADVPAVETTDSADSTAGPPATATPPSGPKAAVDPAQKPTHSVRGDRTLTGGTPRQRLTDTELAAKLASMRSKNETLALAHARAEADAANFEAREAVAAKKDTERRKQQVERQKQERKERQQMMGERERNRLRKLEAKGRAWDEEKEEGFAGTGEERRRGAARGAFGGVAPSTRSAASAQDVSRSEELHDDGGPSSRSRGRGRGGRAGRGGGRGDHHASSAPGISQRPATQQQPPKASDFPDLPSSTTPQAPRASSPPTTTGQPAPSTAPKPLSFPLKSKATPKPDAAPQSDQATAPPASTADAAAAPAQAAAPPKSETAAPEQLANAPASAAARPDIKKAESFGLGPMSPSTAGKSWADQVEGS